MPATSNFVLTKGKNASAAIVKKRFVKLDTAAADGETVKQCDTLGEYAYGVAQFDVTAPQIAQGKGCTVQVEGRVVMEADGALPVGTPVTTAADGRAHAAAATHQVLGYVDEPAAGAGNECSVLLSAAGIF